MTFFMALLGLLVSWVSCADYPPPREPYTLTWTGGPFVWPSSAARALYKTADKFVPANMVATRFALFRDEVFVAYPRYRGGVCATLAHTSLLNPTCEAAFEPFPCWETQAEGTCHALQNVVDVYLDDKNILWALDSGITDTLDSPVVLCAPKAVGFDPSTGKRLHTVDLSELARNSSRLQYLVADCDSQGRHLLYISDAGACALLVYNIALESGYRVVLPETVSQGCSGEGDVLYLVLVKTMAGQKRLYLSYLCGSGLYSIDIGDLQTGRDHGAVTLVTPNKPGKIVIIGADCRGLLYFRYEGAGDIYGWKLDANLTPANVTMVHRGDSCLLATHAVFDPLRARVRVLLSNFLDFLRGTAGVGTVHVLRALG